MWECLAMHPTLPVLPLNKCWPCLANNVGIFNKVLTFSLLLVKVKLIIFELFCLQNSLIVGMQPQVSGKVGSLVGWLVFGWTMVGIPDECRILLKG